jgi:hypothetical protein
LKATSWIAETATTRILGLASFADRLRDLPRLSSDAAQSGELVC